MIHMKPLIQRMENCPRSFLSGKTYADLFNCISNLSETDNIISTDYSFNNIAKLLYLYNNNKTITFRPIDVKADGCVIMETSGTTGTPKII